ncbi:MAG TPA: DUF2383 domain-containing protein [Mucilaginibacter sp.]|nr:DUF2383 domain-containing protein [Mucilaginibacter sp.]
MEFVIKINDDNLVGLKNKRSDHPKYLNELIASLSTCIENYKKMADESDSPELKEIANKLAIERSEFVLVLNKNFSNKNKSHHNVLSEVKPLYAKLVKGIIHSKGDQRIMDTILKSELNAVKKYNTYLYHHIPTIEQLNVLIEQKRTVNNAIDLIKADNSLYDPSMSFLVPDIA